MPPPTLIQEDEVLVHQLIETFMAGRSGAYPASYSDLKWNFIAVLKMFDVKRRPLPYNPFPPAEQSDK
jgi:hypothetical protein